MEEENVHFEANQPKVPLSPFLFDNCFRIYNCLKRSIYHTLLDLFELFNQEGLMKMEHFRLEDVKQILGILENHFAIDLPKNKF
ncbi:hypothetical protein Leryth_026751 [Lithospermum erythrorhizon]|nr:hypothetical protein Leryth_026751 [Lithospermum erythrorhizon]